MSAWRALGLDGAVAYTFLARLVNILGSTVTVLLIARLLSSVEQGYYYTLLSLLSLQMVFEMGFSFVIQQLAAHECAHLELKADGTVSGDPAAHRRVASTLQLSLRWYTLAAAAMALILTPAGVFFFAHPASDTGAQVAWRGPWLTAVLASSAGLWSIPFYSFLEGCGQVRAVAAMRLRQAVATVLCAWAPMLLGHGLYSPAMALVGYVVMGWLFLFGRRHLLRGLLRHPAEPGGVCWSKEVWPFQWRIAVSWTCAYFTVQVFIPILFAARGAVEAGRMGMSLSMTGYLTVLALAWTSTKTTPFAGMIARREFQRLDDLFFRTLRQSTAVFALLGTAACVAVALLPVWAPRIAARMAAPPLFAILVLASGANFIAQSMAILLRCFKNEPFLVQSLTGAFLTLVLTALTVSRWGSLAAGCSYLVSTAGVGLPIATLILIRARRSYLGLEPGRQFRCEAGPRSSERPLGSKKDFGKGDRNAFVGL